MDNLSLLFRRLITNGEFQILVREYRQRFGVPALGFSDTSSKEYDSWITEAQRKPDLLRDNFLFIAKRCLTLVRGKKESNVCPVSTMSDLLNMIENSDKVLVFD